MNCHIKKEENVIIFNGKELSQVADEIEEKYFKWLEISGLNQEEFIDQLNMNDFDIFMINIGDKMIIGFDGNGENLGEPFGWDKESNIILFEFVLDVIYLLKYISERCTNPRSQEKIMDFINTSLRSLI